MADTKLVTGLFWSRAAAEAAVREVSATGYRQEDITLLMSEAAREKEFGVEGATKAAQGAAVGGLVGGTTGAVLAAIAAVGTSIALPGLGVVVAGPVAAMLAGAGAGGATGGLVGLLVGAGIPEHRAKVYEAGLREGGILLGVEAKSDKDVGALKNLFESLGARDVRQE